MSEFKKDMIQIQQLISNAFTDSGSLVAVTDGGQMSRERLQRTLEQVMDKMERATLSMRLLCEKHSPGCGGYGSRPTIPAREVTGAVDRIGSSWLHITLRTLLPHCRFQTPGWLVDTLRRLLDEYEAAGGIIPCYREGAVLFLDEHSSLAKRQIYDQDNKGWKTVSNALKGRVFPDDSQYALSLVLLSRQSSENVTHITVTDAGEAGDFLSMRGGYSSVWDVYAAL